MFIICYYCVGYWEVKVIVIGFFFWRLIVNTCDDIEDFRRCDSLGVFVDFIEKVFVI